MKAWYTFFMRICIEKDCDRKHQAKGYCQKHYQYHKEWGRLDVKKCTVNNCDRGFVKKNYCKKHYDILYKYNVLPDDYEKMLEKQSHSCAVCNASPTESLVVDHKHSSGEVRGLLCRKCNVGIGMFMEDISKLKSAIKYLS